MSDRTVEGGTTQASVPRSGRLLQPRPKAVPMIARSLILPIAVIAFLLVFARGSSFHESVVIGAIIAALLGQGFNIIAGYGGWFAFGNQLFFGMGAYTVELGVVHHYFPPLAGLFLAVAISAVTAYALGRLLSRLDGMLFSLTTFALSLVVLGVVITVSWTGGPTGLQEPLSVESSLTNLSATNEYQFVVVGSVLVLLVALGTAVMRGSRYGHALVAARDDSAAAESCGVATVHVRALAWALSAAVTAVAGVLFVQYTLYVSPNSGFGFGTGIQVIVPAMVGGLATVGGPVLGCLVVLAGGLLNQLSTATGVSGLNNFLYAILLVLAVRLVPGGLIGISTRAYAYLAGSRNRQKASEHSQQPEDMGGDLPPAAHAAAGEQHSATPAMQVRQFRSGATSPARGASLLDVSGLSKSFGGLRAVDQVSLEVAHGEIVGLVGPNGSGKTTVINCVTGIIKPDTGDILLAGKQLARLRPHHIARAGVSRTYQTVRLFSGLTVAENVEMPLLRETSRAEARQRALDVLSDVGLAHKATAVPKDLSLSEHRKVELARAVCSNAKLILLDEVMAGLTASESQATGDIVKRLAQTQGLSFVIVEHVMASLLPLVHRLVVMDQGRVLTSGTPDEVMKSKEAVEAYFGAIR